MVSAKHGTVFEYWSNVIQTAYSFLLSLTQITIYQNHSACVVSFHFYKLLLIVISFMQVICFFCVGRHLFCVISNRWLSYFIGDWNHSFNNIQLISAYGIWKSWTYILFGLLVHPRKLSLLFVFFFI